MRWLRKKSSVSRPWRMSAKLLVVSSVVTVLGFSAVCASVMLDMRHGEEVLARQTSENLAATINADIGRTIELYDLSLRAVVTGMLMPEIDQVSKPLRDRILFDHAATAKHFGALQVFDAAGNLTIDALRADPAPENHADEEYFTIHRDRPDAGLFVSRPMLHRGAYAIVLSRRISAADGSFLGVVAGSIRFSYFHQLFDRLNLGADDTIGVFRRDGTLIMRKPFDLDKIGKNLGQSPIIKRLLSEPSGSESDLGPIDRIPKFYVWRDATGPLSVLVGRPWDNVYALWRTQATRIGFIMATLIGFVIGVTLFLAREIARRARAERSLEELATTDALTGLKNRRKFDITIDVEWRRAARSGTPLALLLIDADHFKVFNDTFGHQPGDHALAAIASCIDSAVRRAGDCAARYGGEEFAVLLPGRSADEALAVAESIRTGVERLRPEPVTLTVSVGVVSLTPTAAMHWTGLMEAADKALYAAKAAGRNRSMVANAAHLALVA
jgi:diguanylate cyclase (GGDEF)-like protein